MANPWKEPSNVIKDIQGLEKTFDSWFTLWIECWINAFISQKYCEAVNYCQATKLWASKAPAQKIWSIYSANNFICFFSTNILHRMLNAIKIQHDRPRMVAPRCLWYLVHYCCNSNFHVHQKASLSPTKPCDVTERKILWFKSHSTCFTLDMVWLDQLWKWDQITAINSTPAMIDALMRVENIAMCTIVHCRRLHTVAD